MITLMYHAHAVGPVCRRVSEGSPRMQRHNDREPLPPEVSLLIRWGSRALGEAPKVINTAEAVSLARNKQESRRILGTLAPRTWFTREDIPPGLPCVIRPRYHHGGERFFVCRTPMEMLEATRRCRRGWYASELINKRSEYRIFILHGHVVCVSQRFPARITDVAWNLNLGGRLLNVHKRDWPLEAIFASIAAMNCIGLDWGAVDVAQDVNDRVVVFEVNTAPGLRNPYTMTQIARVFNWSETHHIPIPIPREEITQWRHVIHPALRP